MREIDELIVHATATQKGWMGNASINEKVAEIRKWHKEERGWNDIGYHYLIDEYGVVAKGREDGVIGAHVKGRNAKTLGIALLGGYKAESTDKFSDHYSLAQDRALRELLEKLSAKYNVKRISGHNEYSAKGCPGFKVNAWLDKKPVRKRVVESTSVAAAGKSLGAIVVAGGTAISQLEGNTQLIVAVFLGAAVLYLLYMAKERIRHFMEGVK